MDINCELSYEILQNLLEKMFVHALSLVVNHGLLYLRAMRGNSVLKNKEFWVKYSRIGEVELLHFFAELHLETKNLCRHYDRYKGSEEQAATSTISASTHLTQNTIEGDSSRNSMSRLSSKRSLCHSMSYDSILGDEDEPDGMEEIINLLKHEKPFKLRDLLKFVPEEKWSDVDPTYVRNYLDLCGLNDPQVKKLKHLEEFDKPQIASIYPRFSPSKIAARAYSQARIIGVIDSKEKVDWRNNISRVPDTAEKMDISMNDSMRGMCVPKAPAYYVKPSVKASVSEDNSDSWLSTVLKFVWGE